MAKARHATGAGKTGAGKGAPTAPRRGRPTQAQAAAIDGSILVAARRLFLANGYADTSMEAVAAVTGVSKGTLYARYPTKAGLFHAIIEDWFSGWSTTGTGELGDGSGADVAGFMTRFGITFLEALRLPDVAALDRLVVSEAARFPELALELHRKGYQSSVERLAAEIERSAAAGGPPVADAHGVAYVFMSALLGWHRSEAVLREPDAAEIARFVDRAVALIGGGRSCW